MLVYPLTKSITDIKMNRFTNCIEIKYRNLVMKKNFFYILIGIKHKNYFGHEKYFFICKLELNIKIILDMKNIFLYVN